MLGVVFAQAVHPPLGVVPHSLRVGVGLGNQRIAFPQKTPQATVDEAGLVGGGFAAFGRFDSLVDQRVRCVRSIFFTPYQGENHAQQGIGLWRRRPFGQLLA